MMVIKLQGGLGNQLFQWAFYKSLDNSTNESCFLDNSLYEAQMGITEREFSLDKFPNIKYKINVKNTEPIPFRLTDNFYYHKFNLPPNQNYYFDGYWQTEKYFKDIEPQIRYELSPNEEIKKKLFKIIPKNNNSISLHIRRTDYLKSNGFHPVQDIKYYDEAIKLIGDYDFLYVFSDDIDWCKKNLRYENIIFVGDNNNVTDIWLQSICKNNIIANSSFSWWGAWLNNNPNKKVIAPKLWFGQHVNINSGDIVPDEWIKL